MTTQEMLISRLVERFKGESQAAIARRVGISATRFNNYALGTRKMDDDAIIGCATALGIDPKKALAAHNAEHASTARAQAFWKKLSTAAALLLTALPFRADAYFSGVSANPAHDMNGSSPFIHYAQWRARLRQMFTRSRNPSPVRLQRLAASS